jgi:hypothetical protein
MSSRYSSYLAVGTFEPDAQYKEWNWEMVKLFVRTDVSKIGIKAWLNDKRFIGLGVFRTRQV